eukprot:m.345681 g.345681  ORF g.345681 m.345681 type:complete len:151 (-) comp27001_c0_seq1:25-477(-)
MNSEYYATPDSFMEHDAVANRTVPRNDTRQVSAVESTWWDEQDIRRARPEHARRIVIPPPPGEAPTRDPPRAPPLSTNTVGEPPNRRPPSVPSIVTDSRPNSSFIDNLNDDLPHIDLSKVNTPMSTISYAPETSNTTDFSIMSDQGASYA